MKKNLFTLFVLVLTFATVSMGQIRTPPASPGAFVKQTVGLTEVEIDYSRPSAKGRTIFAENGLVPYGQIWRTGANTATKITFGDKVMVEGKELAAGSYAILTKPSARSWDVHFYKYESSNFGTYVEKTPDAVVTASVTSLPINVETFSISVGNITNESASLNFIWANIYASVNFKFDVDSKVMADITRVMSGPSETDYFNAGSYMHDAGKDLAKALEYVQKATKSATPRFWQVRKESLILADMGRKAEAIAAAKKSLELAKEAKNADYIKMNEDSIKQWSM